ncbi:MAG: hypothetical protein DYG94_02120 [Leptolyngbya sp. PLA3]|nr:MAG: hypothetical protein EDM82_02435 [Cyanobacteria bacterium CYA]MCE7967528.1 hypothetical protein [Leptolyngbya sp. PL-A3]
MDTVLKIRGGWRSNSHRRSQCRQREIEAARADLAALDRVSDEVLDVVTQRLWEALGLEAEMERQREKARNRAVQSDAPAVCVKINAIEAASGAGPLAAR